MRIANEWKDFEVIDTSGGEKLERWGKTILIRPDPQILWNTEKSNIWKKSDARYVRSTTGGGHWENPPTKAWNISYKDLTFQIRPTNFKHTGLFPEQAVNWDFIRNIIQNANRPVKALNLFAYTGGATLALAAAGANVCHVDAAKGMVNWACENAQLSNLKEKPIRWIVDDCQKFVEREIRRGNRYDIVIMDPPSYGRGPDGEVWKIEDNIYALIELCSNVLSDDPLCFMLSSYTTGLSPSVMEYILSVILTKKYGGFTTSDEIGLPVTKSKCNLPCGSTAIWQIK